MTKPPPRCTGSTTRSNKPTPANTRARLTTTTASTKSASSTSPSATASTNSSTPSPTSRPTTCNDSGPDPPTRSDRHYWNNIVRDIEAYRIEHDVTDPELPLGPRPTTSAALHTWTRLIEQYADHGSRARLLITLGEDGMWLFEKGHNEHIPTVAREVFDVSGAGDTVIATFTLALACGATKPEAAYIANFAAGIVLES